MNRSSVRSFGDDTAARAPVGLAPAIPDRPAPALSLPPIGPSFDPGALSGVPGGDSQFLQFVQPGWQDRVQLGHYRDVLGWEPREQWPQGVA